MINPITPNKENEMPTKPKATAVVDDATPTEETTFSAKDLATELKTDPKSFRRWLRAHTDERANKGGRWSFTAESKADIIKAYGEKAKGTDAKLKSDAGTK